MKEGHTHNYCRLGLRWRLWVVDRVCMLCNEEIEDYLDSSIDHITPKSKGGSNHISNLQITHMWCNSEKGNLHPLLDRFFRFLRKNFYRNRPGRIRPRHEFDKY